MDHEKSYSGLFKKTTCSEKLVEACSAAHLTRLKTVIMASRCNKQDWRYFPCRPPAGAPALCHHGRSDYQPLSLVSRPNGAVVCTAKRFHKKRSADRARQHDQKCKGQHKERDHRSGPGGFSGVLGRLSPFSWTMIALRFKASAATM